VEPAGKRYTDGAMYSDLEEIHKRKDEDSKIDKRRAETSGK